MTFRNVRQVLQWENEVGRTRLVKWGPDLISSRVGGDELYVIQRMIALKLYDSLGKASNYYENISLYNKNIKFIY